MIKREVYVYDPHCTDIVTLSFLERIVPNVISTIPFLKLSV